MKLALSSIAIAVAIQQPRAAAASNRGRSHLPSAYVRSMGLSAIRKARSQALAAALAHRRHRLLPEGADASAPDLASLLEGVEGLDLGGVDLDGLLDGTGGFDLSSVLGDVLSSMAPAMCAALDMGQDMLDAFGDTGDGLSLTCSDFGCDDAAAAVPNLVMECRMDGEVCEEHDGEAYCATGTSMSQTMALNLTGTSAFEATQCNDFTSPPRMAAMGTVCLTMRGEMEFGNLMSDMMSDMSDMLGAFAGAEAQEGKEEEADAAVDEFFRITSCSSSFNDGAEETCKCGICGDGTSFELVCPNDLITEECTAFEGPVDVGGLAGGGADAPAVAVLRLIELPGAGAVASDVVAPETAAPAAAEGAGSGATDAGDGAGAAGSGVADDAAAGEEEPLGGGTSPAAAGPGAAIAGLVVAWASAAALL